jgi:hypothetical protein
VTSVWSRGKFCPDTFAGVKHLSSRIRDNPLNAQAIRIGTPIAHKKMFAIESGVRA